MYRFRRKWSYLFTLFSLAVNKIQIINADNPLEHLCLGIKRDFEFFITSGDNSKPEVDFDPCEVTQKFIFIQLIISISAFPRAPIGSPCIQVDLILSTVKL